MKLVVDIGNTNIVFGIKNKGKWEKIWRFETDKTSDALDYSIRINNILWEAGIHPNDIQHKILSTVVPDLLDTFKEVLEKLNSKPVIVLDKKIYPLLDLQILNPNEIGSDLVSNAIAAHRIYPENIIIIDFGTALTFTVLNKEGKILGVNIAPGLKTAIHVLGDKTAQLDVVPLEIPDNVLGQDTKTAIQNGVLLGYIGLISHMIQTIKQQIGNNYKVLATGGLSSVLKPKLPQIDYFNKELTLEGLAILPEIIAKKQ